MLVEPFGEFAGGHNVAEVSPLAVYAVAFLPEIIRIRKFRFVDCDRVMTSRPYEIRLPSAEAPKKSDGESLVQKQTLGWRPSFR